MQINQELQTSMLRHVKDWQLSGLSQIGYCQEQGISFSKFNYWVRKLRPSGEPARGFAAIKVEKEPFPVLNRPIIELVLPNGARVNFYKPVDPSFLRSILY